MVEDGVPEDDGERVEYFSCPMLFIPEVVWEYYERHLYLERFPHTAPPLREEEPRFLAFDRYFRSRLNEYRDALDKPS